MNKLILTPTTNVRDKLHQTFMSHRSELEEQLLPIVERMPPAEFINLAEDLLKRLRKNVSLQPIKRSIVRKESTGIVTFHSDLETVYYYRIKFRQRPLSYACLEEMAGAMEIHHCKLGILITNTRFFPMIKGKAMPIPRNITVFDGPKLVKLIIRYIIHPILP